MNRKFLVIYVDLREVDTQMTVALRSLNRWRLAKKQIEVQSMLHELSTILTSEASSSGEIWLLLKSEQMP